MKNSAESWFYFLTSYVCGLGRLTELEILPLYRAGNTAGSQDG